MKEKLNTGSLVELDYLLENDVNISIFIPENKSKKKKNLEIEVFDDFKVNAYERAKLLLFTKKGMVDYDLPCVEKNGLLKCNLLIFLDELNIDYELTDGTMCGGEKWKQIDTTSQKCVYNKKGCAMGMFPPEEDPDFIWGNQYEVWFPDNRYKSFYQNSKIEILRFSYCSKNSWNKFVKLFILMSDRRLNFEQDIMENIANKFVHNYCGAAYNEIAIYRDICNAESLACYEVNEKLVWDSLIEREPSNLKKVLDKKFNFNLFLKTGEMIKTAEDIIEEEVGFLPKNISYMIGNHQDKDISLCQIVYNCISDVNFQIRIPINMFSKDKYTYHLECTIDEDDNIFFNKIKDEKIEMKEKIIAYIIHELLDLCYLCDENVENRNKWSKSIYKKYPEYDIEKIILKEKQGKTAYY